MRSDLSHIQLLRLLHEHLRDVFIPHEALGHLSGRGRWAELRLRDSQLRILRVVVEQVEGSIAVLGRVVIGSVQDVVVREHTLPAEGLV